LRRNADGSLFDSAAVTLKFTTMDPDNTGASCQISLLALIFSLAVVLKAGNSGPGARSVT
ncbi:MAG: hypothetical protein JZU55_19395, partial [Afipia sp.]|nr:hypothetical protein [Afipia sp.]